MNRAAALLSLHVVLVVTPLTQESHVVQFQSQEAGTDILAEWIIAVRITAVYEFQSKIKEE